MLQSLSIKNVALIKDICIEFGGGFNVLLGETGAGKSIIFDSLNFVLGAKIDKTLLRTGETQMRVDAVFSNLSLNSYDYFKELGFDIEEEICLSRTYSLEGKSSCRINGIPCSQSQLREIGTYLVDSYSQHESVTLLNSKNHLGMLDRFGGDVVLKQKAKVQDLFQRHSEIDKQIKELGGDQFEREKSESILEYQINEIESASLKEGEDIEIHDRLKFLGSAEKIYENISECEALLSDNAGNVLSSLKESSSMLSNLQFDEILSCKERLDSARIEIEDICETLVDIKSKSEYDKNEYNRLDSRYDKIKSITKKYGGDIESTLSFLKNAKEQLLKIQDSEFLLDKYEKQKTELFNQLLLECNELTKIRKGVANNIEKKILNELKELGMKSSQFEVQFKQLSKPSSNGIDDVEFIFSANKGQEIKSLSKTASGGELSRFMLAVKNIFAEIGSARTLIFDEIDSGISGETGNIVGQKLDNITSFAQILCITHLPQVACFGDDFFYVSKEEINNSTQTKIKHLNNDEIIENIARMTVGNNLTEASLKQAQEMVNHTKNKLI